MGNSKTNNISFLSLEYLVLVIFLFFLFWNTGIHSDDFHILLKTQQFEGLSSLFFPDIGIMHTFIYIPVTWLYVTLQYYFFGVEHMWAYDLVKVVVHFASIYCFSKFFSLFFLKKKSLLLSVLFVFYPIHDAVNYWMMCNLFIICPALIFYGYYLLHINKYFKGFLVALIGCMFSYGCIPFVFGLSFLFLLQKKKKHFLLLFCSGFIYLIYYISIASFVMPNLSRINKSQGLMTLLKSVVIQVGTFFDAQIGPSLILKLYFSILENNLISFTFGIVISALVIYWLRVSFNFQHSFKNRLTENIQLLLSFAVISLLGLGMFAVTGGYPQITFNLGNRVTMVTQALPFLLLATLFANKKVYSIAIIVLFLSMTGISNHWTQFNKKQLSLFQKFTDIKNELAPNEVLYTSGLLYSRFGSFDHIDFFASPSNGSVFWQVYTEENRTLISLSPFSVLDEDKLVNKRENVTHEVDFPISVFDSNTSALRQLNSAYELNELLVAQDPIKRHWVQLLKDTYIMNVLLSLSPRLRYIFP